MLHVKSGLGSEMTANSLSNRRFAVIYKERIDDNNTEQVAKDFIATVQRRKTILRRYENSYI